MRNRWFLIILAIVVIPVTIQQVKPRLSKLWYLDVDLLDRLEYLLEQLSLLHFTLTM